MIKNKRIITGLVCLTLLTIGIVAAATGGLFEDKVTTGTCIQDPYGDQYNIVIDPVHSYVTGTLTIPGAPNTWPILGSYVGKTVELTMVNPTGDPNYVVAVKLKGSFPNASWYYDYGYSGGEFTYTACGAPVTASSATGGFRK